MILMVALAIMLGRAFRHKSQEKKNRVLIAAALLIDGFELLKIAVLCLRSGEWNPILSNLPLFLCSIQLITIPLAAFSKGRVKEASMDFVCIFGLLGAVMGTYGAGNNYGSYPVLSMDNVVSGITHSISGFTALYIFISGMVSMKKENKVVTFSILLVFCALAYGANHLLDYNYMFLMRGDGTPYDILYNLVSGHPVIYPLGVVALFLIYITGFYGVYRLATRKKAVAPVG
jgi:uncharacterized membrane protein YwaF